MSVLILFAGVWALQPYDNLVNKTPGRFNTGFNNRQPDGDSRPFRPPFSDQDTNRFKEPPPAPPADAGPSFNPSGRPPFQGSGRHHGPFLDIISVFLFIIIMIFSLAINFLLRMRLAEQRALQADADKANAELSFLKAQINPHFLFNTLNNIYSLAASQNENTAESIMKLSNIMRYVTDDVAADFVPLENEVAFIQDYIDLQLLRLGKKMNVRFTVTGSTHNKKIAPLVLVTFIENVFKYGISNHEKTDIILEIIIKEMEIVFFSQNKIFANPRNVERTGIGITNTIKRLEHLYPGRYQLDINTQNEKYTVTLTLQD